MQEKVTLFIDLTQLTLMKVACKQIEVADFASVDYHNRAYMELVSVSNKNSVIKAKIKIDVLSDNGVIQRKVVEVDKNKNNNLYDLSGKRDVYENYLIRDIYCEPK
jgi:type III restriction enzyme